MAATARRRVEHSLRCMHASACRRLPEKQAANPSATRDYFYDIDQHGQLFLSNTKIRNFTSCYKDPAFLDFFYKRLKPLKPSSAEGASEETHETLNNQGYTFVSLCGSERNYIRSQDTPIVFRELIEQDNDWYLKYAGTLATPFQPESLKVDNRGYLYHPSPEVAQSRQRRSSSTIHNDPSQEIVKSNPYGQYSLLRSELVISKFGRSLDMSEDGSGSYEWLGKRRAIRLLQDGEVTVGKGRDN